MQETAEIEKSETLEAAPAPVNLPPPPETGNTHFDFQAKVFQAPGAHFILKSTSQSKLKVPMFAVEMGNGVAVISLKHLRTTFEIGPGTLDDQLIERAAEGLKYVPDIRPGDAIPNELLNGKASWTVGRRHKAIAREKIQAQLLSWMTGEEVDASDREGLKKIMEEPETKKKLRDAFHKAAVALGFEASDTEKVIERIETLARELCYIEALRDRCEEIARIRGHLERLVKVYNNDIRMAEEITRCKALIIQGIREVFTPMAQIDIKLADIVGALQTIDALIAAIRRTRDDIHFALMDWDPVLALWHQLQPVRGQQTEKALRALYQLLALRFATGKSMLSSRKN